MAGLYVGNTAINGITVRIDEGTGNTDLSDATANSNDIRQGKSAYIATGKTVGTLKVLDTSSATATAADVLKGKIAFTKNDQKIVGTLDKGYDTSDSFASPSDIKKGIKVYTSTGPIIGTYEPLDTSDATATSSDIKKNKTAYINGEKVVGTSVAGDGTVVPDATENDIVLNKIAYNANGPITGRKQFSTYYTGTNAPSNSLGKNGDIYFRQT